MWKRAGNHASSHSLPYASGSCRPGDIRERELEPGVREYWVCTRQTWSGNGPDDIRAVAAQCEDTPAHTAKTCPSTPAHAFPCMYVEILMHSCIPRPHPPARWYSKTSLRLLPKKAIVHTLERKNLSIRYKLHSFKMILYVDIS
jgi:hypothetical protein